MQKNTLEFEALMIRYHAALLQLPRADTPEERFDLLAVVVLPSEDVLRASLTVAGLNRESRVAATAARDRVDVGVAARRWAS
jgi:hypothetical protein